MLRVETLVETDVYIVVLCMTLISGIKTHGSESRGQEEAACTRVFWPTRPLHVSYLHGWQL